MAKKKGYTGTEFSKLLTGSMTEHLRVKISSTVDNARKNLAEENHKNPTAAKLVLRKRVPLKWTVEDSFLLQADGLVFDHTLGTTGIIHFIENQSQEDIQHLLENAAYVKHLTEELQAPDKRPPIIEVVFVVLNWDDSVNKVGNALRNISDSSTLLHTIGISLLAGNDHEDPSALRRAFPWLLTATQQWFQDRTATPPSFKRIEELFTENYRVPGKRHWEFDQKHGLHVVHGPNGSGKSSLVETFELILTGKIERIAGEKKNYPDILTHHTPEGEKLEPLELKAKFSDQPEKIIAQKIGDQGISSPLSPEMTAGGFRLNQHLSNQLIFAATPAQRAAVFLENFFPEDQKKLQEYQRAQKRVDSIWQDCPAWVHEEFHSAEAFSSKWESSGKITQFFPKEFRSSENAPLLERLFQEESSREDEHWKDALKRIDVLFPTAAFLHRAFVRLERWRPDLKPSTKSSASSPENRGKVFNSWLHQTALIDLLEKERDVTATLAQVNTSEDRIPEEALFVGMEERTPEQVTKIDEALREARELKDSLENTLSSLEDEHQEGENFEKDVRLTEEDVNSINELSHLIGLQSESNFPVGDILREITEKHSDEYLLDTGLGNIDDSKSKTVSFIKSPQAFSTFRKRAEKLEGFLKTLGQYTPELLAMPPSEMRKTQTSFSEALAKLSEYGDQIVHTFSNRVSDKLNAATNELMALMTPARWAYENIKMEASTDDDGQALAIHSGEISATAKLNTAELNTMALALFLLSAVGREKNPLCTIILDDPFENMDELTTVTVARTIGRLQQLWLGLPALKKWRTIMFLHGAENVERVRDEVHCAAYFLPWLSPGGSNPENEIRFHKSRYKA